MFGPSQNPSVVDTKNKKTLVVIFGVGTAVKCCELKRCTDRVRSRTGNKDEVLTPKRHLSILLNFFFSIYRYLIFFFTFETSTLSNNRFAAQKYRTISCQEKMTFSSSGRVALRLPSPYARAYADVRTKFSPINRLPRVMKFA